MSPYRSPTPVEADPEDADRAAHRVAFYAGLSEAAAENALRLSLEARRLRTEAVLLDETLRRRRARLAALRRLAERGDTVDAATLAREAPEVHPAIGMAPMRVVQL